MSPTVTLAADELLSPLLADAGLPRVSKREPVRVWAHSGVERLHFVDGKSVIFKYADAPFDREHVALQLAEKHGIPVPHVYGARATGGRRAMLMEDLGEPLREAGDNDGARAAVQLHTVAGEHWLPRVDTTALAAMPRRIAAGLDHQEANAAVNLARALAAAAPHRAAGAQRPPFGLCHSEYHPTSLNIGRHGWRLLDLARAFTGPGLLDLASWHGTIDAPDPARTTALIERYVSLGGHKQALAERGGLNAAEWALGWHRVWVADWFTEQIRLGWAHGAEESWITAITRHLNEAANLLHI